MSSSISNLVFSGGGILGIAYIGMLDYLYHAKITPRIHKVAGTSAGAITACIFSFNLPFEEFKAISDTLEYTKVTSKEAVDASTKLSMYNRIQLSKIFDNIDCVYRLITNFGWFSSNYFYDWIKTQIASQFDVDKKAPPYTFADFKNTSIHKNERPFRDLYIIGTNVSHNKTIVFSYDTTPNVEVAEAVRISMSVPLLFEAVKSNCQSAIDPLLGSEKKPSNCIYADGGLLYNYPLTLFDTDFPQEATLGALFRSNVSPTPINNLVDFITHVLSCTSTLQYQIYHSDKSSINRTIEIYTDTVSSLNFNVVTGDDTYTFLYNRGYQAAEAYFSSL